MHKPISSVAAPGLVWSCDITFTAAFQSTTIATTRTTPETAAYQTSVRQAAAAEARRDSGRNDVQIEARPEPTAMAVPPTGPQRRSVQSSARTSEGDVAGVAARWWVTPRTTAYPRV